MKRTLTAVAALCVAFAGPAGAATYAITNARVLTAGPAGEIASGTVVVRDGKIVAVGPNVPTPAGAEVVDAKGGIVTPGFVAANSLLGAVEIGALGSDASVNNPELSAAFDVQYALNPDSFVIPVARLGGITSAVVTPRPATRGSDNDDGHSHDGAEDLTAGGGASEHTHGLFSGQAAVIQLAEDGEPLVRAKVAMVAPFGDRGANLSGGARGAQIVLLKTVLQDVRAYRANRAAYERAGYRDLALSKADLEALIPVVEGRMPLIAVANRASDIRAVLKLAREEKLKVILSGATEGWRVAAEIAAAGVPVILNPIQNRPASFESLGASLENAARLNAAGVSVIIEGQGGAHRAHETRYNAGNAVAYGLPYEAALKAVTINPARAFGVANRLGSLEPGKDADLVVWSGDPFEPLSRPQLILIRGEPQPLTSRQYELRDRYKDLNRPLPPAYSK
ncbi:amidohydrolase family protein [Phenylobacterium sp. J426]|uniref:amidohydrolase family protein n=1 Tax=Phenylobacterium sp. J426 TaxID=2898439 RepID=UPI0021519769|nr:amidohydrolase family protein [Phenylobacterium sp. J426]MCR5875540.1 amidohydrolase family protein [Phenylobacterium sp. J426]